MQQRLVLSHFEDVCPWLFAYNEVPAIAVAIDCWFRARLHGRALFSCAGPFQFQTLVATP